MSLASIPCPECGNDLWEIWGNRAHCTNCRYNRPFHRRRGHNGKMTPSQQETIDRVTAWFKRYFRKESLFEVVTEFRPGTGHVHLKVQTTDHPLTSDGAWFSIGRRGGLTVLVTIGLSRVHDKKFYAKFLKAQVS